MNIKKSIIFLILIILAIYLRIHDIQKIPPGLYLDEASIGYNSYSILKTGKDEYGKRFPIFFRSFATFQSPLYAYLTTIPISIFDLNIFSVRIVSVISGIIIVLITFLFSLKFSKHTKYLFAFTSLVTITFAPWAILDSRAALEANLALALVVMGIYFLMESLSKPKIFIPGSFLLALSTYAYHAERIFSITFILTFLIVFRRNFSNSKKYILSGILIFFLLELPQLILLTSPASLTRLNSQGYLQMEIFKKNAGALSEIPGGRVLYIIREFTSQYTTFFSPRSLFSDPEPQLFRSIPQLSTFYFWMIIPFFFGIVYLYRNRKYSFIKVIILTLSIGPIAGALTKDPFYTLRVLPMLWAVTIVISLGLVEIYIKLKYNLLRVSLFTLLSILSFIILYTSYFILLKYERSLNWGYHYIELSKVIRENPGTKFLLDSDIDDVPYILLAFYNKFDPEKMQKQTESTLLDNYYTNMNFNRYRNMDNIEVRKLKWGVDTCKDQIIIADSGAISPEEANIHKLSSVFTFKDLKGETILTGYKTNPKLKCNPN